MQGKSLPWSIKEDIKLTQSSLNSLGKSDLRNSNLHGIKDFYIFSAWWISFKAKKSLFVIFEIGNLLFAIILFVNLQSLTLRT